MEATMHSGMDQGPAQEIMARHAKTFFWANQLMPSAYRRDFWRLYAFCRTADDAVDEARDAEDARRAVDLIRAELAGRSSRITAVAEFLEVARRRSIPLEIPLELLAGVESDNGAVRIKTEADLLRYAYRVASTVGLMVCHILNVRAPQALAHAIDLGIGMQLTNIARDVIEDAARDKCYLPASWIPFAVVDEATRKADLAARGEVSLAVLQLLDLAQLYYRSADCGIRYLPFWSRWGILTASRCYEAIGAVIRERGPRYWTGRSYTTRATKTARTLGALGAVLFQPRYASSSNPVFHDANLHAALHGLPSANARRPGHE